MFSSLKETQSALMGELSIRAQKNANLMTGLLVAIIIVTGIGVTQGKTDWWIAGLALLGIFVLIFLILNAILLVKIGLSLLSLIFTLNFIFELGTNASPKGSTGLIWVLAQVFLYFFVVALSYLVAGTRSRWTTSALTMILSLIVGAALVDSITPKFSILASLVISIVFFVFVYRYLGSTINRTSNLPANRDSEKIYEQLTRIADESGWELRRIIRQSFWRGKLSVSYLVWKEKAFVLYPVNMQSKLTLGKGRRNVKLLYQGHSINGWLLLLAHRNLPLWKTKNAPMTLILLDSLNGNGKKAETIGVGVPDSTRKLAVGMYPSVNMGKNFLNDIDDFYAKYSLNLSPKHKKAMAIIGRNKKSKSVK
jgi:hypothetical protein